MTLRSTIALLSTFAVLLAAGLLARADAGDGRALTVDLADDHVDITTSFDGARLNLFGVKDEPGDLAVVVRGPEQSSVVRYKSKVAGIWMNTDSVRFNNVPVYYDLALSVPEQDLAPAETRDANNIGLDALEFSPDTRKSDEEIKPFKEGLVRNKQAKGYFPLKPRNIYFLNGNFFRVNFYVPANVPTGNYAIQTYLFREGKIVDVNTTQLRVAQVGFSARIRYFAMNHAFFYALGTVLFAVLAGASAYYFLRKE